MSFSTLLFHRGSRLRRLGSLSAVVCALSVFARPASAHPLGNFTTNTATVLEVDGYGAVVTYIVDLAEIPALKVRQEMGAPTGAVPLAVAARWRGAQCQEIGKRLTVTREGRTISLSERPGSRIEFPDGQAGLTTLRLDCKFTANWTATPNPSTMSKPSTVSKAPIISKALVTISDRNFPDRIGWREITAKGIGVQLRGIGTGVSPTDLLRQYPNEAINSPLRQLDASFEISSVLASSSPSLTPSNSSVSLAEPSTPSRGLSGLTEKFQSLMDRRTVTFPFLVGALLLALLLGGLHALAPGHGKTIIAAYALGRRGRTADIVAIGGTVAATHTVGIMLLGVLVSATSVVSPDRTFRWASVLSGVLVIGVGCTLLRSRLRIFRKHMPAIQDHRSSRIHQSDPHHGQNDHHDHDHHDHDHHDHDHDHHDHDHHDHDHHDDHDHDHDHDHDNDHDHHDHDDHDQHDHHDHEPTESAHPHPEDDRFIVTSHSHGGWSHDHVLPAPGAVVRRRELVMMGLAGGLVPSPSALVVLLGAIAVGRVPFGIALVVAYGIGLAATLVGAGLAMVHFERGLRSWSSRLSSTMGIRINAAATALPLVSGFAITAAGVLLLARSIGQL